MSTCLIGRGADVGTDCRASPTTCSVSGLWCLGEPPCIHTTAWLAERPVPLARERPGNARCERAAICVLSMTAEVYEYKKAKIGDLRGKPSGAMQGEEKWLCSTGMQS